jgi:photosystem II stability/assembly factor-like uncharacterized protein
MLRSLLILLASLPAFAQSGPRIQLSHTTESLRGVSAVSREVAWASGTHGTYLRTTDAGLTWTPAQVPDATALDFRAVVAFSADEALLMSAGPGEQSRIYHTTDAGQHWQLQFTNKNPKGFFDSMIFWDPKHGVVLGDPIPDDSGHLKFELLLTDDGQTWQVFDTPIIHGPDSAGIFSIAFRDATHGVIAGGDYKHPNGDGPNLAFTNDGGETWTLSELHPLAYFSAVAYDRRVNALALGEAKLAETEKEKEKKVRVKPITPERIFLVGQDFVFDFSPPNNPHRINGKKKQGITFNAAAPYPEGGVLVVGPKGSIASIP